MNDENQMLNFFFIRLVPPLLSTELSGMEKVACDSEM